MRRLRRSGNGAVVSRSPSSVARVQSPELVSHVAGLSFLLVLALLEGNTPVLESGEEDPRRGMSTAKFHYSHYYYYYYQHYYHTIIIIVVIIIINSIINVLPYTTTISK